MKANLFRKKTTRQLLSWLLALTLIIGMGVNNIISVQAVSDTTARYSGSYSIKEILANFQIFTKGDYRGSGGSHTMGAVVVGDTLAIDNSAGDVGISPSYVNHIEKLQIWNATFNGVPENVTRKMYYGTADANVSVNANDRFVKNPDYINIDAAFTKLKAASKSIENTGTKITESNNGKVVVDFSNNNQVVIDASLLDACQGRIDVLVPGTTEQEQADYFASHTCVITVTGNVSHLNFNGDITINGNNFQNFLKKMSGSSADGQFNFHGMNLVWNLPDTTAVTTAMQSGHLIAPNASVTVTGGNYEGNIIAQSVNSDSQAHFYKYTGIPLGDGSGGTSTEPEQITVTTSFWGLTNESETNKEIPKNSEYQITLTPEAGNVLTEIDVIIGDKTYPRIEPNHTTNITNLDGVIYNPASNTLVISADKVTDNIYIKAVAESNEDLKNRIYVTKNLTNVSASDETPKPAKNSPYQVTITPYSGGYTFTLIKVQIGTTVYDIDPDTGRVTNASGQEISTITFNPNSCQLKIAAEQVTDNMIITATAYKEGDSEDPSNPEDPTDPGNPNYSNIDVTKELTGVVKKSETVYPKKDNEYQITLEPKPGKAFTEISAEVGGKIYIINPNNGAVTVNGTPNSDITVQYNPTRVTITLPKEQVTTDIKITAEAKDKITVEKYLNEQKLPEDNSNPIIKGNDYKTTIVPSTGKELSELRVEVGTDVYYVDVKTGNVTDASGTQTSSITFTPGNNEIILTSAVTNNNVKIIAKDAAPSQTPGTSNQPAPGEKKDINVTKNLSNVSAKDETQTLDTGKDYEVTLTPKKGYTYTEFTITIGTTTYTVSTNTGVVKDSKGETVAIHYNKSTGRLLIPAKLITDNMTITAKAAISKVPILKMNKTIAIRSKFKIDLVGIAKNAKVTYKSSNKKIATINKKGIITGKKLGKCKISADVVQDGSYYRVRINLTVKKKVIIYSLKKKALSKKAGTLPEYNVYKRVFKNKKTKIKFMNVEKNAKVTYTSSNPKVATVKKNGKVGIVSGKKQGFTVVTAKIKQNGKTYITRIFVRVDDYKKNKKLPLYLKELK